MFFYHVMARLIAGLISSQNRKFLGKEQKR